MEKSNIIKQAKYDIYTELYKILSFYIKKGAGPKSLKKYYANNKRFKELLEDINNKSINLFKNENDYKETVEEILNDILDDFIAKEKDDLYNKKKVTQTMKHVKEYYQFNENWITDSTGNYNINYNNDNISEIVKEVKMYIEENFNKINSINSKNLDFLSINFNISNDIFGIHLRKKDNFYFLDFREKDRVLKEHEVDITKEDFDYLFNFILYIHNKFREKEQYDYKQKIRSKLLGADKYNL